MKLNSKQNLPTSGFFALTHANLTTCFCRREGVWARGRARRGGGWLKKGVKNTIGFKSYWSLELCPRKVINYWQILVWSGMSEKLAPVHTNTQIPTGGKEPRTIGQMRLSDLQQKSNHQKTAFVFALLSVFELWNKNQRNLISTQTGLSAVTCKTS